LNLVQPFCPTDLRRLTTPLSLISLDLFASNRLSLSQFSINSRTFSDVGKYHASLYISSYNPCLLDITSSLILRVTRILTLFQRTATKIWLSIVLLLCVTVYDFPITQANESDTGRSRNEGIKHNEIPSSQR
jgi:hypothetical protein